MTGNERKAHARLSDLIRNAQVHAVNARSAPAVADILLRDMWDDLIEDDGVHRMLMRSGLNAMIRTQLTKITGNGAEDASVIRDRQLEMWPDDLRATVAKINREAVFVPSRDEFVELVPDAISTQETREAGDYLISHGEDAIRRGNALHLLADLRDLAQGRAA